MALTNQGPMLGAHQDQLRYLTDSMGLLLDSLHCLANRLPEPSPAPMPAAPPGPQRNPHTPGPEPKIAAPQRYVGRSGGCKPFLAQCSQIFRLQPYSFATEAARVAYIITWLSDRALLWATALVVKKSPICDSLEVFTHNLRQVFDHPVSGREAARRLLNLRQGPQTVVDYTIQFRTLAEETGWEEEAINLLPRTGRR